MTTPDATRHAVEAALERVRANSEKRSVRQAVITFRLTDPEHLLLELVAEWVGESLSAFVRASVLDTAKGVVDAEGGPDAMIAKRHARIDASTRELTAALRRVTEHE